jgi:hypothetical protein
MALYKSPISLMTDISWMKVVYDAQRNIYIFVVTHRNIVITDCVSIDDSKSLAMVSELLYRLRKSIDYYLDAIWC